LLTVRGAGTVSAMLAGDRDVPSFKLMPRGGLIALVALVGLAGALLRRADGSLLWPLWAVLLMQAPVVVWWVHARCGWFVGAGSRSDRWLTAAVLLVAVVPGWRCGDVSIAATAVTVFIVGALGVSALARLYYFLDERIDYPKAVLRVVVGPWALMIAVATGLLVLPIATQSGVPDYRHNFLQHLANSGFAATSAACLVGLTVDSFAEDYTWFGQGVLILTMQLAAAGFAAVGLAVARPMLRSAVCLRTVLLTGVGLQAAGAAVMYGAWDAADAPTAVERGWLSLVQAAGALCNTGWRFRPDGLAPYLDQGAVFITVSLLAVIGSLGLPILIDLVRASRAEESPPRLKRLSAWESTVAFMLLGSVAVLLFVTEAPALAPHTWYPERPVDLGGGQVPLGESAHGLARWRYAVFASSTLRSAGMQSLPIVAGSLSWPGLAAVLASMTLGGTAAGLGGGIRTTTLLVPMMWMTGRAERRRAGDVARVRGRVLRMVVGFVVGWLLLTVASIALLAATTEATVYEVGVEATAGLNNVALSTGLSLHLTRLGRLAMIGIMIAGRLLPLVIWSQIAEHLSSISRTQRIA